MDARLLVGPGDGTGVCARIVERTSWSPTADAWDSRCDDLAHIGFEAFNWLAKTFKPRLWLHGHEHRNYNPLQVGETQLGNTRILNVHPYRIIDLEDGWNV